MSFHLMGVGKHFASRFNKVLEYTNRLRLLKE